MSATVLFTTGAVLCAIWATVSWILITAYLDKRGIKTSLPLMRWYYFRNLGLYREQTFMATGKVGPLFISFVVTINIAWILALLAILTR